MLNTAKVIRNNEDKISCKRCTTSSGLSWLGYQSLRGFFLLTNEMLFSLHKTYSREFFARILQISHQLSAYYGVLGQTISNILVFMLLLCLAMSRLGACVD